MSPARPHTGKKGKKDNVKGKREMGRKVFFLYEKKRCISSLVKSPHR